MFISMLLLTCVNGAEPIKAQQHIVPRPVPAGYPRAIMCLPPASALNALRVESEIDQGPTSALTALGIDQAVIDANPVYPSSVTKEVAEILLNCEAASRQIKTSKVKFDRTVYNLVFEVETRSEGELCFEAPDKQSINLRGVKIAPGTKSLRNATRSGQPFRLESGRNESWILTNDEIATANGEEKTYERFQRPMQVPDDSPRRFCFSPSFPFLFDIRADQIRTDWTVTLQSQKEARTILKAAPRTALLKCSFAECLILIDNKTWRVAAVKYFDPSGNLETIYKLGERTINEPLPADCFDVAGIQTIQVGLIGICSAFMPALVHSEDGAERSCRIPRQNLCCAFEADFSHATFCGCAVPICWRDWLRRIGDWLPKPGMATVWTVAW